MTEHAQRSTGAGGMDYDTTALQRSEELYRVAAEIAGDLIYDWNFATNSLEWFGDIDSRLGYSPGEFPRTFEAWERSIHRDDHDRVMAAITRHLETNEPYSEEYRIVCADGTWRIWTDRGRVIRDHKGDPCRWIGISVDVTEQRAAERLLRSSEERFHAIIDQVGLGMAIADTGGRFMMVNQKFADIVGYGREELLSLGITDITYPEDLPYNTELLHRASLDGEDFTIEKRYIRKDGSHVWVYNSVAVVREQQDGRPKYFVALVLDINHQKQVELALRESEQQLKMALETGRLGSWQFDLVTGIFDCSSTCMRNFGLDPAVSVGYRELLDQIDRADRERTTAAINHAIETHQDYEGEYRIVWPDGSVHWIVVSGRGLYDDDGRPLRLVGVTLDITTRKMIEEERQALLESERISRSEAERASRMKEEFLATISHELRTPLNAILGWAQLLRGESVSHEELARGLEIIERNARVQTQIIEDLLDMSRIISGKVRLDARLVDLPQVIESALETMRPAAQAKGIRVQQVLDPSAGPVLGDSARLQQVVWNLLSNSIKFTPSGGKVQIVLTSVGSYVELRIADTGKGIAPEFLPHVFERFRQADSSTTRTHGGLGLGLAIVKNLVEMHGGTVQAMSEGAGTGATFVIRLPLSAISREQIQEGPAGSSNAVAGLGELIPSTLAGIRVLVVDDEPDARDLVRRLLREYDADVGTAGSAAEALALIPAFLPDVLISDIGMPEQDGYELIRAVRNLPPDQGGGVPAVALTAFARSEDRSNALLCGFQTHMAKPVEPAELITVVASLAGRIGGEFSVPGK